MSYSFGPPGPIERRRGFGSLGTAAQRDNISVPSLVVSAGTFVGTLFAARAKHSGIGLLAAAPFALGNAALMGFGGFVIAVLDDSTHITSADREKAILWCGALSALAIAAPIAGTLIGRAMQKR
jgi:hypothetical protein